MIDDFLKKFKELCFDELFKINVLDIAKNNVQVIYNNDKVNFVNDYCEFSEVSLKLSNISISKSFSNEECCFVLIFEIYEKRSDYFKGLYKLILDIDLVYVDDYMLK